MSKRIPSLIRALSQSKSNQLQRIDVSDCRIGESLAADLVHTINAMPGLQHLLDLILGGNMIGSKGCLALATLLKNTAARIHHLALGYCDLQDEFINIIFDALVKNSTLKTLDLGGQNALTLTGWRRLSEFLTNPRCSIENLMLEDSNIDDEVAISVVNPLAVNRTLRSVNLSYMETISPTGWQGLFTCLSAPNSSLKELSLEACWFNDEAAESLFSVLARNETLKILKLKSIDSITATGWVACFQLLMDSESKLEKLDFSGSYNFGDREAIMLANLLSGHT